MVAKSEEASAVAITLIRRSWFEIRPGKISHPSWVAVLVLALTLRGHSNSLYESKSLNSMLCLGIIVLLTFLLLQVCASYFYTLSL